MALSCWTSGQGGSEWRCANRYVVLKHYGIADASIPTPGFIIRVDKSLQYKTKPTCCITVRRKRRLILIIICPLQILSDNHTLNQSNRCNQLEANKVVRSPMLLEGTPFVSFRTKQNWTLARVGGNLLRLFQILSPLLTDLKTSSLQTSIFKELAANERHPRIIRVVVYVTMCHIILILRLARFASSK